MRANFPLANSLLKTDLAMPVQFRGSRLARELLRWMGWKIDFQGLPAMQGVAILYPHTSNWDFPVAMLLKSAMGIEVKFWAKDSLFNIPVFGRWLRWLGGVPLMRNAASGVVAQMVALIQRKKTESSYFWLALSPEGTRSYQPGWRSGFYRVALEAGVPLALASLDYSKKILVLRHYVYLSGDTAQDMQDIALVYEGVQGYRPGQAAPIKLLGQEEKP
jgi:1-acyl-sn-glycerol-3-phosphate acyltransferase